MAKESITQVFCRKYQEGVREIELTHEQILELFDFRANSPVMIAPDYPVFCNITIKNFA